MTKQEIFKILQPIMENISKMRSMFGGSAVDITNRMLLMKNDIYKLFSLTDPHRQDYELKEFGDWLRDKINQYIALIKVRAENVEGDLPWEYGYSQLLSLFEDIAEYTDSELNEDFFISDDEEEIQEQPKAAVKIDKKKKHDDNLNGLLDVLSKIEYQLELITEILTTTHNKND